MTQRQVDHSKLPLSRVLIKMERKIDLVEEEHEREHEESESSGDEREDVEPRIKDVLSHLSRAVPEKCASDLLYRMAASKDILFWTPRGQLLRNERIIPVKKNIAYNHGQKSWDSCTVRTLFNTRETVSARY